MTKNWGALLALPTAIALTLGGAAAAAPALAGPAHAATTGGQESPTAPEGTGETEPVPEPSTGLDAAESGPEAEEASHEAEEASHETEEASDAVGEDWTDELAGGPVPAAAAPEEALTLTSPVAGSTLRALVVDVTGTAPGATRVDVAADAVSLGSFLTGVDGTFGERLHLPQAIPSGFTLTVTAHGPDGATIGTVERVLTVDVPTSTPVTVLTPTTGSTVTSAPGAWGDEGWGSFTVTGTGTPGQYLALSLTALDLPSDSGTDGPNVRVGDDGRWTLLVARPFGTWRVGVSQFGMVDVEDRDGYTFGTPTTRLSAERTVDVRLARVPAPSPVPADAAGAPIVAATVPHTTWTPTARTATRHLAHTGGDERQGDALLAGGLLVGLGAAAVLAGRRRASGRRRTDG